MEHTNWAHECPLEAHPDPKAAVVFLLGWLAQGWFTESTMMADFTVLDMARKRMVVYEEINPETLQVQVRLVPAALQMSHPVDGYWIESQLVMGITHPRASASKTPNSVSEAEKTSNARVVVSTSGVEPGLEHILEMFEVENTQGKRIPVSFLLQMKLVKCASEGNLNEWRDKAVEAANEAIDGAEGYWQQWLNSRCDSAFQSTVARRALRRNNCGLGDILCGLRSQEQLYTLKFNTCEAIVDERGQES
eukprot:3497748-Amphidinium_carterae.1